MPRWASRITLEIINLRVERLRDMTLEDIPKEGFEDWYDVFRIYWDKLYQKKPKYQWYTNPFVWVIEFKKI